MRTVGVKVTKIIAMTLVVASIHAAISGIELPQQFLIKMMVKNQDDLQEAADSFAMYTVIASIWTLGSSILMLAEYGIHGLFAGLIGNIIVYTWMFIEYNALFNKLSKKYSLEKPKIF